MPIPLSDVLRIIAMLEYDAASYDLTARFAKKKGFRTLMQRNHIRRVEMAKKLSAAARRGK